MTPTPYPFMSEPPAPAQPKRSRIVERYGERFCTNCGFPAEHCGCDRVAAETPPADGHESDLARRVRQARQGRE